MSFDIFISFKLTEQSGKNTYDSSVAQKLYHSLLQSGYKVFYSDETITLRGNSDFQKEIDAALESSKLLIVVASKMEYIRSKWIEYEWQTFNGDILSNIKQNSQIVTYTDKLDTRQMPRALRYKQNFKFNELDKLKYFIDAFFKHPQNIINSSPYIPELNLGYTFYQSSWSGEFEILRIRAAQCYDFDIKLIKKIKQELKLPKYNVLVIGCAYGFVAETRFGLDDEVENVICIDNNAKVIEKAKQLYSSFTHMKFYQVNIEGDDYVEEINNIINKLKINNIDIVFTSNVLKYLNNPSSFLRKTRKLLSESGFICIRDTDDDSKIAYPDKNCVLNQIIQESKSIDGMPNFSIGKELPYLLRNSGFNIFDIQCNMRQTANLTYEQKENIFNDSFGGRMNLVKNKYELTTDDQEKQRLKKFSERIRQFEDIYYDNYFWYCEFDLACIAKKG